MRFRFVFLALVFVSVLAVSARAFMVEIPPVSIDRLIKNTRRYLRHHPGSADGHYTLARLHYFAFASGRSTVHGTVAKSSDELPGFDDNIESAAGTRPLTTDELADRRRVRAIELVSRNSYNFG